MMHHIAGTFVFCFVLALSVFADELPTVPPGFEIKLVAKEPLVRNPCSMAFDARGRLCVGMGPQYRNAKPDTPGDSVMILLDKDGDGAFESRKQFATGFNCIQGLAWHGKDLWVANAPDLTIVRDLDGDDVADEYVLLYTDLGNLEHGLHGLNWGPDGRMYMSKGNSKGLTKPGRIAPKPFRELWGVAAPEGSPDIPAPKTFKPAEYKHAFHDPRDDWGREGGILVCDDMGRNLEIVSRGFRNPWDIAFDSGFNWQGTDNDQNQGDRVFMPFFGSHFGWGHSWSAHWTGHDHPPTVPITGPVFHGSGTGMSFYDAKHFPSEFQGVWFFNDWARKTTFVYRPVWDGALIQPAGGKWQEFVRGKGLYKPTDLEVAPDGSLYILGWGRQYGVEWKNGKQANEGRIFRVSHTKAAHMQRKRPDRPLSKWSVPELIKDFNGPIPIWRVNAQGELIRRGNSIRDELVSILENQSLTKAEETWTAWTLGRIGAGDQTIQQFFAKQAANQSRLNLRLQALRILAHRIWRFGKPESLPSTVQQCLKDKEPRVRLEAVQAIRRAKQTQLKKYLIELAATEDDRVVFYAAWQALRLLVPADDRKALLADPRGGVRRAALLSLAEDRDLRGDDVIQLLSDSDEATRHVAALWNSKSKGRPILVVEPPGGEFDDTVVVRAVAGLKPADVRFTTDGTSPTAKSPRWQGDLRLTETTTIKVAVFVNGRKVGSNVERQFTKLAVEESARRSGVFDVRAKSKSRYRIVDGGLQLRRRAYTDRPYVFADIPEMLLGSLIVQTANDDAGSFGESFLEIDTVIPVTLYFGHDTRVANTPSWLRILGNQSFKQSQLAVRTNDAAFRLYERSFPAGRIRLGGNTDDGHAGGKSNFIVIMRPAGLPPLAKPTLSDAVLSRLKEADIERGRALFYAQGGAGCAKCHRADGKGQGFGPDLLQLVRRNEAKHIVTSILKPNAEIKEGFTMQTILTGDGRVVNGILHEETKDAVTLVSADLRKLVIRKSAIEDRRNQRLSPMPSFERLLTPQQVADITAWLLTTRKRR